jgi:4-amino-4-deoxy-L-arabinose transferase-like glycosyltransferase
VTRTRLAAELAAIASILAAHVWLLTRLAHTRTVFDEAVYLVSLDELRRGSALGGDVFTSQLPGFYLVLQAVGAAIGTSVADVRWGLCLTTASGALFAYLLGRRLGGPLGGLLAAGLLAGAPLLPLVAGRIFADPTAMALVLAALWLASIRRGAAAGAVFAFAVLVKLSAVTAAPALVALLALEPPRRRILLRAAAGAAALVGALAIAYARDLGDIWEGAVSYHVGGRDIDGLGGADEFAAFWDYTTPYLWLVVAGIVATVRTWRRVWPLWLWPPVATLFVLTFQPLRDNHLVLLPYAFAVPPAVSLALAARRLPERLLVPAVAVTAVALVLGWDQQRNRVRDEQMPESPALLAAAAKLERVTSPGDFVVSDQPIVTRLAHRRTPGDLVDTASLRFDTGSLTIGGLVERIDDDPRITAVVAGRSFFTRPALLDGFRDTFEHRLEVEGAVIFYGRS